MDFIGLIPSFGSFAFTVLAFVVALTIIVAVHEYGHYIVGRWSGIQAEVFSIGFGPRLFSRVDRRGTRWQIAAIPLGGYVKFLGDANAASGTPDDEVLSHLTPAEKRHTLHGAPLWARAATVVAGPMFNFILSVLIFAGIFLSSGIPTDAPVVGALKSLPGGTGDLVQGDRILAVEGIETPDQAALFAAVGTLPSQPSLAYRVERDGAERDVTGPALYPPRVEAVAPGSAAMDSGLERGDVVVSADGVPVNAFSDLQRLVLAGEGKPVLLGVWRDGAADFEVTLSPRRTDLPKSDGGFETRYLIGISGGYFFDPATRDASVWEAVKGAGRQTYFVAKTSLSGMWHMITGAISSCNLRGPIGIAETSGAAASQGTEDFVWFLAYLSTAVGLLNLFPIPVLDGGHLVFHAWEWGTGRPPSDKALRVLMTAGVMIVLSLMAFGLTNDFFCP